MLKSFIVNIVFICLIALSGVAYAGSEYAEVSNNAKIGQALDILKTHNDATRQTLNVILRNNLTNKPIKIMFYDLSLMNAAYAEYDALACKHTSGSLYILINTIHQNSPAEAIACLLSHEVHHQDDVSSYQEEIQAWTAEATTWMSLKKADSKLNDSNLNKYPLVKRLNSIEKMYTKANFTATLISEEVHTNSGYRGLAEYSPGFGI